MKVQLTVTGAAELEMLAVTTKEFEVPRFKKYLSDIVGSHRKLRGALERVGLRRNEDGWKGLKRLLGKTIEIDFSREEVLVLIILVEFAISRHIDAEYRSLPDILRKMNARAREVGLLIEK